MQKEVFMYLKKNLNPGKALVSAALSLGLIFSQAPVVAFADDAPTQSVEEVSAEVTQLLIEAEQSQYDLISVSNRLDKTNELIGELDAKIEESSNQLAEARQNLSKFVSEDYKQGSISLLDILVSSSSFDDLVSQIIYANKIAEHQRDAIIKVDELYSQLTLQKSELEKAKADQEVYLAEQQEREAAVQEADMAAQAFIEALPPEMVEQLNSADAEQREAAMQASMEVLANMDQEQLASIVESAGGDASSSGSVAAAISSGSSSGSSSYSDLLSRVYSLLGSGYQWSGYNYTGDTSTSSFTCSGVVDYGLGRSSQSSSPETLYEEVGSNLTTDVSQLKEGDLVFYSYGGREVGHVGVYVGDGQVIDSIPNGGVAVRDVNYMTVVGGGSLG